MKILIFDKHPVMRDAIYKFIENQTDNIVSGLYSDEEEFINYLQKNNSDVIIMDFMGSTLGVQLLNSVMKFRQNAHIILYTSNNSEYLKSELSKTSNLTFICKTESIEKIDETIEILESSTHSGYQLPRISELSFPKLTPKEKKIVDLLSKGHSSKDMAEITNTSFHTINNQKKHLIAKYRCNNSTEMLYKLINLGYVDV